MASILSKKQRKKDKYTLKELKSLGRDLLSSRAHINNLPLLLSFVSPESPPQFVVESVLSLQSFFIPLLPQLPSFSSSSSLKRSRFNEGDSSKKAGDGDPELIYKAWARSKFDEFVKLLLDVLVFEQSEDAMREIILDTLMEFVKLGNGGRFHSAIYHRLLHAALQSAAAVDIFSDTFSSKYFKYIDVRYFTYISMEKLVKTLEATGVSDDGNLVGNAETESHLKESLEHSIRKIYHVLSHIPPLEKHAEQSNYEMWSGTDETGCKKPLDKEQNTDKHDGKVLSPSTIARRMKLKFTKAWISFLRLPLPLDVYKEVLVSLPQAVIPHLSNPSMLCDILTKSYDIGGVISVMALSSLFILMTQHGLEYPNFYEKLYALLAPSIFMAKHRARFFQLLDTCLKSPLLPAYLAASFTKKLSRLSLSVPPSGSLVITALIHNLLRRHPSINCLVHWEITEDTMEESSKADEHRERASKVKTNKTPGVDYFNNRESDPMKTSALKSSLWEIDTLRHHYCPSVSRFVLSLENDLTVRAKTTEVNIEDLNSGSYATIFGDEIRRRVKQVPLSFYKAVPTSLFADSEFPGWTFEWNRSSITPPEENAIADAKRQRVQCS